jgi:hypothetical protein
VHAWQSMNELISGFVLSSDLSRTYLKIALTV